MYVDDLNIIGHIQDINKARNHLTIEFEMKYLRQIKFCLDLQLEHLPTEIFVYQAAYIRRNCRNLIWTNHIHQSRLWLCDHLI
jgi:hypothetical protein